MTELSNTIAPVAKAERILALDVLRGFAIAGILIVNIQAFSMIEAAYFNPTAYGDLIGWNKAVWYFTHIFADSKFMAIFSILFGAGIGLFAERMESKGLSPASYHYRRTIGLLILGVLHAYLLWYGDILVWYSLCALLVFLFHKKSPKTLLTLGVICLLIPSLFYIFTALTMPMWPPENFQEMLNDWKPGPEMIQREIARYQGSWSEQMQQRIPTSLTMHTLVFLVWASWRAGGLMLIGMALYKWDVLTAKRSRNFYLKLMGIGFAIGFPLIIYGVVRHFEANWSLDYSRFLGSLYNYWGSLGVSLAYISAIMLICKAQIVKKVTQSFAAVGRTALTNYLLQTIICTTIFYGHGFGLFGEVERSGQILIVVLIVAVQLVVSPIWLRHFRFGPFEWLWRSFTYLKLQPMRVSME